MPNKYECINCEKDYRKQVIFGKEPDLCIPCTLFYLNSRERTLNDLKSEITSDTYWNEIKVIEVRRNHLKK